MTYLIPKAPAQPPILRNCSHLVPLVQILFNPPGHPCQAAERKSIVCIAETLENKSRWALIQSIYPLPPSCQHGEIRLQHHEGAASRH